LAVSLLSTMAGRVFWTSPPSVGSVVEKAADVATDNDGAQAVMNVSIDGDGKFFRHGSIRIHSVSKPA
jgi:hypothetical protein